MRWIFEFGRRCGKTELQRLGAEWFLYFFVPTGRTKRGKPVFRFDWRSWRAEGLP